MVQAVLRPVFYRGHNGDWSKPCMPATSVVAASHVSVASSASVCASAMSFDTLRDPQDIWVEVEIDSDGDIVEASAAPSASPQEIHRVHAEAMAVHAATSPAADTVDSWEELFTDADDAASSRLPCFNAIQQSARVQRAAAVKEPL